MLKAVITANNSKRTWPIIALTTLSLRMRHGVISQDKSLNKIIASGVTRIHAVLLNLRYHQLKLAFKLQLVIFYIYMPNYMKTKYIIVGYNRILQRVTPIITPCII